jgi:hypothetical protein
MTDIEYRVIAFADKRETTVRELIRAMHDCIDLKREIGVPLLAETRAAIDDLEDMVGSLKLALLRHHPGQLVLDGLGDLSNDANEGEHAPALVLGS